MLMSLISGLRLNLTKRFVVLVVLLKVRNKMNEMAQVDFWFVVELSA